MEIRLEAAEGCRMPVGSFVAVKLGDVLKQGRYEPSRTYSFAQTDKRRHAKIDLFKHVGSSAVLVNPDAPSISEVAITGGDPLAENLRLKVDMKPQTRTGPSGASVKSAARGKAQAYLDKHGIETKLSDCMKLLLQKEPDDPVEFICNHLRKTVPQTGQKSNQKSAMDDDLNSLPIQGDEAVGDISGTWRFKEHHLTGGTDFLYEFSASGVNVVGRSKPADADSWATTLQGSIQGDSLSWTEFSCSGEKNKLGEYSSQVTQSRGSQSLCGVGMLTEGQGVRFRGSKVSKTSSLNEADVGRAEKVVPSAMQVEKVAPGSPPPEPPCEESEGGIEDCDLWNEAPKEEPKEEALLDEPDMAPQENEGCKAKSVGELSTTMGDAASSAPGGDRAKLVRNLAMAALASSNNVAAAALVVASVEVAKASPGMNPRLASGLGCMALSAAKAGSAAATELTKAAAYSILSDKSVAA
jgi:hypothetical protein